MRDSNSKAYLHNYQCYRHAALSPASQTSITNLGVVILGATPSPPTHTQTNTHYHYYHHYHYYSYHHHHHHHHHHHQYHCHEIRSVNLSKSYHEPTNQPIFPPSPQVHQFFPLVGIRCSPDLQFFLCSMYTPICMESYNKHLPACKSLCERARNGCGPLMR